MPTGLTFKPQGWLLHFLPAIHSSWIPWYIVVLSRALLPGFVASMACVIAVCLFLPSPFSVFLTSGFLFNEKFILMLALPHLSIATVEEQGRTPNLSAYRPGLLNMPAPLLICLLVSTQNRNTPTC